MPTLKQKIALDKTVVNGGNITKAMKEAGYKQATINNPVNLTKSKGWKELLATIPDEDIIRVLNDGLNNAYKVITSHTEPDKQMEDFAVRLNYAKEIARLKNRYPVDDPEDDKAKPRPILQSISITTNVTHVHSNDSNKEDSSTD